MNLLRLIGQHTLHGPDSPVRHPAQRRRIKTVMKEVMFKAARLIRHARRWSWDDGRITGGLDNEEWIPRLRAE